MKKNSTLLVVFLLALVALNSQANAQTDSKLGAADTPNDNGGSVTLSWELVSPLDQATVVKIFRGDKEDGEFVEIGTADPTTLIFADAGVENEKPYFYKVSFLKNGRVLLSEVLGPAVASKQWFDRNMIYFLIITLLISGAVIYFIETAKRGKKHFVRKIAGLEAVDEAIGRATEMGRPLLYIPGSQDMDNVQTLAGLNILGMVSKKVAEYDSSILMPSTRSLVMTTAREIVKESYMAAGRPDAYNEQNIYFTSDEQFGFVAAVNGVLVREKPAACFYLGAFYAESLVLAEVGNSIGAIQIAGTAMPHQIPFFIAACDYTLIGEELFAASAYLSQNPQEIGSLKGQDIGKAIAMVIIAVGAVTATVAGLTGSIAFKNITEFLLKAFTA